MQIILEPSKYMCESILKCSNNNLSKQEFDWMVTAEVSRKLHDYSINELKLPIAYIFDIRYCRNIPMFEELYKFYDKFVEDHYH